MAKQLKIAVEGQEAPVSGLLELPKNARALLAIAHGAGAGMLHPFLTQLAKALHTQGIGTLRYQFPYMERGGGRPDSAKVATKTVVAAVAAARAASSLPIFAGGTSFGSRMTTTAASQGDLAGVTGIVCFGFPLHAAKAPDTARAAHLENVRIPTLFLQGTRDDLADLKLMTKVLKVLPKTFQMHVVEGADHSFGVLKSSGRTAAQVLEELAAATAKFVEETELSPS